MPYSQHPPKIVPIDVGRQLFVDDFVIESSTLKRTFHTATKFNGNPVFEGQKHRQPEARDSTGCYMEPWQHRPTSTTWTDLH